MKTVLVFHTDSPDEPRVREVPDNTKVTVEPHNNGNWLLLITHMENGIRHPEEPEELSPGEYVRVRVINATGAIVYDKELNSGMEEEEE